MFSLSIVIRCDGKYTIFILYCIPILIGSYNDVNFIAWITKKKETLNINMYNCLLNLGLT